MLDVAVAHHGERGAPLLYIPGSDGDEREFVRYGMDDELAPWLAAGRLQVWAVDGRARDHFWNGLISPAERVRRYSDYEAALVDTVLPAIHDESGQQPVVVGISYGAFVAANLLFKQPERIAGAYGLGGVYGLWHRLDGHHDADVYFHTPLEYVPGLDDGATLAAAQAIGGMTLYAGENDEWLDHSLRFASMLRNKTLLGDLRVWPGADHHERWWTRQLGELVAGWLGA